MHSFAPCRYVAHPFDGVVGPVAQPPASQSPVSDRADRGEESEEEGHTTEDDDFAMSVLSDAPVMMAPRAGAWWRARAW